MGNMTTVTEYEYDSEGRVSKETTTVTVIEAPVGPASPMAPPWQTTPGITTNPYAPYRVWC